jgi:hypothetical protein
MEIKKLITAFILLILCIGYNSCSKDEIDNITDNNYAKICERASDIDYTIVEQYFNKCKSLDELMKYADEIKAIKGVEDVYSNGTTTMFVKIKDFRTMCYSYYPKPAKISGTKEQMTESQLKASPNSQNDGVVYESQDKIDKDMLIVTPTYKGDELTEELGEYIYPGLSERFSKAGFQKPEVVNWPNADVEFFRNGIFECDYLFLITHGAYDPKLQSHWLMTSVDIPRDDKGKVNPVFYEKYKDYPEDQVRFNTYYEKENQYVPVDKIIVSENFIETSSRQFKHPGKAIVFNVACESMKGPSATEIDSVNFSLSRVFELKGAGTYLGYDETNGVGHMAGIEYWTRLLSGMSVKSAYEDLSFSLRHNYLVYDGRAFWADLKLHAPQMNETSINQPEITYIDSSDDNGLRIDLYARNYIESIVLKPNDDYYYVENTNNLPLRFGFELSKDEQFTDVISLGKKSIGDEGCTWDTNYGKLNDSYGGHYYMLSLTQSLTYNVSQSNSVIEPETTYWARAYVYDGTGYCYSRPVSFTTGEYSRIDNVIPPEIRNQMDPYITIYDGNTPPNIEGEYLLSPDELVFDSENDFEIGHIFADLYFKFYNQNMHSNTLDYKEKQGYSESIGTGAFISGSGNNFSVFFNTEGIGHKEDYDINYKTALVISGTKDEQGIRNLEYAFVMVDKSSDPKPYFIPVGAFRVFKDGDNISSYVTWSVAKNHLRKTANRPTMIEKRKKKSGLK